jgi:hypothetical protein
LRRLTKIGNKEHVTAKHYNMLVDQVNSMRIASTQNIRRVETSSGVHLIGSQSFNSFDARVLFIAEVVDDTDITAKGLYNCKLQSFDATDWNETDDGFTDIANPTITGVSTNISYVDSNPDTIVIALGDPPVDGFATKGFIRGMQITTSGTSNNNGTDLVTSVTETTLTVSTSLTAEADKNATIVGKLQVMNGKETGTTTTNELVAGDRIKCWYFTDDDGNRRLIGESMEGDLRLAITKEAAQADLNISVKLMNRAGAEVTAMTAFDCLLMETDDATAATSVLPRIGTAEKILVWKAPSGVWYVVNPTIIKSSVCA